MDQVELLKVLAELNDIGYSLVVQHELDDQGERTGRFSVYVGTGYDGTDNVREAIVEGESHLLKWLQRWRDELVPQFVPYDGPGQ